MPLPTPVREQVLQALFAALQSGLGGDGGPAIASLERNRRPENQSFPAVFQIDVETPDEIVEETGVDRVTATVLIEGQVQGVQDQDLGPAQNELEARVITAATADPTLGGLSVNMTRGGVARDVVRDGSPPTATFSAELQIEFWTKPGRPFEIAP